jgi:Domain of unknown function (DUF4915)
LLQKRRAPEIKDQTYLSDAPASPTSSATALPQLTAAHVTCSRGMADSGLALDDEMKKRDADGWCGVQIVNLASGDIVQWNRIEGAVTELYDVAVLPGVRRPMAASFTGPEINDPLTFEM